MENHNFASTQDDETTSNQSISNMDEAKTAEIAPEKQLDGNTAPAAASTTNEGKRFTIMITNQFVVW